MDYSFENLKYYAKYEKKLGSWNGTPVYAISENDLKKKYKSEKFVSDLNYWIVYDSNNRLVKDGRLYGWIDKWGQLEQLDTPETWIKITKKVEIKESYEMGIFEDCFDTTWTNDVFCPYGS